MEFVPAELRHLSVLIGQSESSESPGSIPRKHCTTCELNPKKPKSNELRKTTENQTFQLIFKLKSCVLNYILIVFKVIQMNLNVCLAKRLTLRVNQPYY